MNVRSVNKRTSSEDDAGGGTSKRGRGRPITDDKRRRILDAALKTFAARGYHGTSVPEVAEAAGVGIGTLYRYFEDKNALVNELYRDAKLRLKSALLDGLPAPDVYQLDNAQHWFKQLWQRLASFARSEPDAFRFLEMQDHVEYLDAESRALELSVLAPLWLAGKRLRDRTAGPPVDVAIALLWGAFVGLVKASRLGYLPLDDRKLEQAGAAAWRMIAPEFSRTSEQGLRNASASSHSTSPRTSTTAPASTQQTSTTAPASTQQTSTTAPASTHRASTAAPAATHQTSTTAPAATHRASTTASAGTPRTQTTAGKTTTTPHAAAPRTTTSVRKTRTKGR